MSAPPPPSEPTGPELTEPELTGPDPIGPAPRRVPRAAAALLDASAVCLFAAVGRRSHDETSAALGVLTTAWPFLVGAAAAWLLPAVRRSPTTVRAGVAVWGCAWALGMVLRALSGRGTPVPFLVVAAIALAVLLLGWRGLAALMRRVRA